MKVLSFRWEMAILIFNFSHKWILASHKFPARALTHSKGIQPVTSTRTWYVPHIKHLPPDKIKFMMGVCVRRLFIRLRAHWQFIAFPFQVSSHAPPEWYFSDPCPWAGWPIPWIPFRWWTHCSVYNISRYMYVKEKHSDAKKHSVILTWNMWLQMQTCS